MTCSPVIPRFEQAPETDEKWEEALKHYGSDRDDHFPRAPYDPSSSAWFSTDVFRSSPPCTPGPSTKRLVHEGGDFTDSLDDEDRKELSKRWARNVDVGPVNGSGLLSAARASIASEASTDMSHLAPYEARTPPLPDDIAEEDRRSGKAERRRLREAYEREGWLPGPQPSLKTSLRRKRAIRNLGLSGNDEEPERKAVIAKYAEMAKQIFQTSTAVVSIMLGEEEVIYHPDPDAEPAVIFTEEGACSHAVIYATEQCTVFADMSKDWRFTRNPVRAQGDTKFYAAAPLRVRGKDSIVDIGTICVYEDSPRDTFDQREQGILLNLANMLVYQLTTLQSEILAKRSSSMYEASISFLRRSILPESQRSAEAAKRKGAAKDKAASPHHRRPPPSQNSSSVNIGLHNPVVTDDPILAVKTGPRDSKDAKRQSLLRDKELFTDVAVTLRRILQADAVAIVNMDEYQLFVRRASSGGQNKPDKHSKEDIIAGFLRGKPWPDHVDPVVHYVPVRNDSGIQILGSSADGEAAFHFHHDDSETVLGDFLKSWLRNGHFWCDRDNSDELSRRIMALMPEQSQTTLATALMTYDGKTRFATFASWNRPPSTFGESSTVALPAPGILGGIAMAALAIRKVRSLEQSQISYSNLQAHELRTPLHQILAITQLLRSSMNDLADAPQQMPTTCLNTMQQIRDLLPFLDAIDTSGKTLHGIVDNILSFLDLKANDSMVMAPKPSLMNSPFGAAQSIEVMFEELVQEAWEEDKRSRRANGQPIVNIETVFEIIPPLLGEQVTEDSGGALRRALAKILSNAYKFIDGEGCVEIYVDDVPCLMPPEGCEDLCTSRRVSIKIVDNGRGMDQWFMNEKLGEPWAKEDPYATGSGLSVHLAYRIIDLMGGQMEVPLPRRHVSVPSSPDPGSSQPNSPTDIAHLGRPSDDILIGRKVGLAGFDLGAVGTYGLERLQTALERQFRKLGCDIVPVGEADIVLIDGRQEENSAGADYLRLAKTDEIVYLVSHDHEPDLAIVELERKLGKHVRRFRKPATPSILRESLFPGQSKSIRADVPTAYGIRKESISSPDQVDSDGVDVQHGGPKTRFDEKRMARDKSRPVSLLSGLSQIWKPKGMPMEDAVASLCLGDYFSSRRRTSLVRTPSNVSSGPGSSQPSTPTMGSEAMTDTSQTGQSPSTETTPPEEEPEPLKVLVVEDNTINRKILVRILSSKTSYDIYEAEDGIAAVDQFKEFLGPVVVLLDINMPRMDGYQACLEMRAIEKAMSGRVRSVIIAVTALSGEADKRRGLVESGMTSWLVKPCGKATIQKAVEEAKKALFGSEQAVGWKE